MGYKSDIEIAQSCEMKPIGEIAKKAHIDEEYIEQYDMNLLDFTMTESEAHGVKFYVFEPKEVYEMMPIAYCAAEGKDGHLLEMVFLAADPYTEVDQNWFYVSSLCSSLGLIQ